MSAELSFDDVCRVIARAYTHKSTMIVVTYRYAFHVFNIQQRSAPGSDVLFDMEQDFSGYSLVFNPRYKFFETVFPLRMSENYKMLAVKSSAPLTFIAEKILKVCR